jgi:hypothetical protein
MVWTKVDEPSHQPWMWKSCLPQVSAYTTFHFRWIRSRADPRTMWTRTRRTLRESREKHARTMREYYVKTLQIWWWWCVCRAR